MATLIGQLRLILVLCILLVLGGCEKGYSGDVGGASVGAVENDGATIADPTVINEAGRSQYNEQCAGCHGANGEGGPGGPVVNCAQCIGLSELSDHIERTMPTGGNEGNCVAQCATDTAEYILVAFNGFSFEEETPNVRTDLSGVENHDANTTLRKASLRLTGRIPSAEEQAIVDDQGEEGLNAALDLMMQDEMFYERLMEMYNDLFLTDKYLTENTGRNGAIGLLSVDDFPNRNWFDDLPDGDQSECYHELANDAVAREPLQLIKYLAQNNLPITGVVNADYIMVNWYSQQVYDAVLVDSAATFNTASDEVKTFFNDKFGCDEERVVFDPNDFKPARITRQMEYETGMPHAGVLTSPMFLNRFPTTETNRNRARARVAFDFFLDTDILAIEGARPEEAVDVENEQPTLQNESCYSCHHIMDPVASAFQHWNQNGRYILSSRTEAQDRNDTYWNSNGIQPPGLAGEIIPLSGANSSSTNMLAWLGDAIAGDVRYRRAVMRTLYRGIVGAETLKETSDAKDAQSQILDTIAADMVVDNWNVKTAIKGIVNSAYFRAKSVEEGSTVANDDTGSSRLLSPEQLQRKLKSTTGREWNDLGNDDNRLLFGGMDSNDVTTRMTDANGIMMAMQQRMAVEMSCETVAQDFMRTRSPEQNDRLLFPYVSISTTPEDADGIESESNIQVIKRNIQYLHWRFLGEELATDSEELAHTYQLFYNVWKAGNTALKEHALDNTLYVPAPTTNLDWCQGDVDPYTNENLQWNDSRRINYDDNYVIRGWMSVVTYLMSDYRFIFE